MKFCTVANLFICRSIGSQLFPVALLAKRGYGSPGPVKSIPEHFSGTKKTLKSASPANREDCSDHVVPILDNHAAGLSSLDGRFLHKHHFHDDDHETLNPSYIQIGGSSSIEHHNDSMIEPLDTNNDNELDTFPKVDGDGFREIREEIKQVAVGLLAARALTVSELRRKLKRKKYPFAIVETVLADLKSRGLLNDGMYAESFTQSRWLSSTWGPRRIRLALHQKGVGESETENALIRVFEEGDNPEGNGEIMQHGMSKLSMDHLFLKASKQWLRSQNTSTGKQRARIVRWLQYLGFNWEVTSYILKKLESHHPMDVTKE